MATAIEYVTTDVHGVMRVGHSHVMLDSVIASFEAGASAETIAQEYPSLSLEEVYGAIAWYLGHRDVVTSYLSRQADAWRRAREAADAVEAPVVARLRAAARRTGISGR